MLTSEFVKHRARDLKFDLCGIAPASAHPKLSRLATWIAEGYAGDMTYLAESAWEREDASAVLPTVKTVVSLGVVYNTAHATPAPAEAPGHAVIARYGWGDDYHDVLRDRLRSLVGAMAAEAGPGFEAFSCVDNGPVQERVFAEQAGLGWIGKNTCVINPTLGSWIFLAEILTNAALDLDRPALDQCGTCTRCLDACPTRAIVEPYVLDATRCLSYLTIESRGPIAPSLRGEIRRQIYGCDICQDVCPWNRRAAVSDDPAWQPRDGRASVSLIELCRLSDDAWRARLKGSAMRRAGLRRIRRSLAYAAASLPTVDATVALDALAAHSSAGDRTVADAIAWARESVPQCPSAAWPHLQ